MVSILNRAIRAFLGLSVALVFSVAICSGLVLLLAGDDLASFARVMILRIQLVSRQDDLDRPVGLDTSPIRFTVSSGDTATVIGTNLESTGLIRDGGLFTAFARVEGLDVAFEAGTYFLNTAQSTREIAYALTDSSLSQISLTVLPGWRIEQVASAIDQNPLFAFTGEDFLTFVGRGVVIDEGVRQRLGIPLGLSLEGFLYPDSYSLPPNITAPQLRTILLDTFLQRVSRDLEVMASAQGWTLYEVVTLASIVQREAVHDDEHALIAGVYKNRLDIDMRLEADPTVQYPLGEPGAWWPRITVADYQGVISDYNTYRVSGLPPGPIANPGLSAMEAVVNPEASNFFFFRADCRSDGYHDFATTYEEHLSNGC